MFRVLLDTNQLVSSLLSRDGLQRRLVDRWQERAFLLLLGPGQIDEVGGVLRRPKIARKYRIAESDLSALLELLKNEAVVLPAARPARVCRDPDDDRLLACAAAGGAEYLVTGDSDLLELGLWRGVVILTARAFFTILDDE